MIVEWNTHMFSPDLKRYPFHRDAAYKPDVSKQPEDPFDAYLQRMVTEGIDRSVLVQPEPYGDDHRLILSCLRREPERVKGTCLYYPKDPEAPDKMEELVTEQPNIIAVRFHAHRGKEMYMDSFADRGVRALWQKALELGLIVELHIGPNYGQQVAEVMHAYPESTVLIDHLAEPHMGDAVEYANILELAAFKNVYMKLSGLGHFAEDPPLYLSAQPFTRTVIQAFGPDRVVWGSGPHKIVDAHMKGYSDQNRLKVKGKNLQHLLRFT